MNAQENKDFSSTSIEATVASLSDLTPRELEILQFVIAGKTNKAIATEIYISRKTVEFHLDNIYTKIGVRTRMMAGIWALRHGMRVESPEFPGSLARDSDLSIRPIHRGSFLSTK